MPPGRRNNRGRVGNANNRGRIGKSGARVVARGPPDGEISFKGAARGRGRLSPGMRGRVRELLPELVRNPGTPAITSDRKAPQESVQPAKVQRIYNDIWASGPASLAFATHGDLDHNDDTIVIALNILDHIIRPENWNPDLSNNKLSASCFYFAAKLTDKKVTATQVAGSIWMDPDVVAGMSQVTEGPLYDRMLDSLTVSGAQVVQGYEILYEQRAGLKDLLGEYGERIEKLPAPATEKRLLESEVEDGPYSSRVATEMMKLGYQRGCGLETRMPEVSEADDLVETHDGACLKGVLEEDGANAEEDVDLFDLNNDFEDFVAEHE